MTFSNNMDRDLAPQNVGPDLRSILFETQHYFLLKTGCISWDDLNSENIELCKVYKLSRHCMCSADPEQRVPIGAIWSGSTTFACIPNEKVD